MEDLLNSSIEYIIILKYNNEIANRIGLYVLFEIFMNDLFSYLDSIFSSIESYSPYSIKRNISSVLRTSNSLIFYLFYMFSDISY